MLTSRFRRTRPTKKNSRTSTRAVFRRRRLLFQQLVPVSGTGAGGNIDNVSVAALAAGTYYLGVSASSNAGYDPVDGSGAIAGSATGNYSVNIRLTPIDANGTVDTATEVSVSIADGSFDDLDQGFDTKRFKFGVSTWVSDSLGADRAFGGNELTVPADIDLYRLEIPADGTLQIDVDSARQIASGRNQQTGSRTPINEAGADIELAIFRVQTDGSISLAATNSQALAVDFFGIASERVLREADDDYDPYTSNSGDAHGLQEPRGISSSPILGGSLDDPFLQFNALAGDDLIIAVFSTENNGADWTTLDGRSDIAIPTHYGVFFNFSSFDLDPNRETALNLQQPSSNGVRPPILVGDSPKSDGVANAE